MVANRNDSNYQVRVLPMPRIADKILFHVNNVAKPAIYIDRTIFLGYNRIVSNLFVFLKHS